MAAKPDVKAQADVTVRHFIDGQKNGEDQIQRRTVYKDRHERYYVKIFGARRDVTRVEGTNTFVLEYHGRTVQKINLLEQAKKATGDA